MHDIQDKLAVSNMFDLVIKEIKGILDTESLTKKQKRVYKRLGKELIHGEKDIYVRNDLNSLISMN